MRRIFVVMAAGMLALAEFFGFEAPELELEPEPEPVEEVVGQRTGLDAMNVRMKSFDAEQFHTHLDIDTEETELPEIRGVESGKRSLHYLLWLLPIFKPDSGALSGQKQSEPSKRLLLVQKRGEPVVWKDEGPESGWEFSARDIRMLGTETDFERLHADLGKKLHLPPSQADRLMAILSAGEPAIVGGDLEENASQEPVDEERLRVHLTEVHAMPSKDVEKVMAVVSGPNPFVLRQPADTADAGLLIESKLSQKPEPGLAIAEEFLLPEHWAEQVQDSVPRLPDPLDSLRTFTREELLAFGMSPLLLDLKPPLPPAASASPPDNAL